MSAPASYDSLNVGGSDEPGLTEFLQDPSLSGTVTDDEVALLRRLRLKGRRPTPLYYYRELKNLRDPLHFRALKEA